MPEQDSQNTASRRDFLKFGLGTVAAIATEGVVGSAEARGRKKKDRSSHHASRERVENKESAVADGLEESARQVEGWLKTFNLVDVNGAKTLTSEEVGFLRATFRTTLQPQVEKSLNALKSLVGYVPMADNDLREAVGYKDPSDELKKPNHVHYLRTHPDLKICLGKLYDALALARCHGVIYKMLHDLDIFEFYPNVLDMRFGDNKAAANLDDTHFSFYVEDCLPTAVRPEEIEPILGAQFLQKGYVQKPKLENLKNAWWVKPEHQAQFLVVLNDPEIRKQLQKEPGLNWVNACEIIRSAVERKLYGGFNKLDEEEKSDYETIVSRILSERRSLKDKQIYAQGRSVLRLFATHIEKSGSNLFDSENCRVLDETIGCTARYFERPDLNPKMVDAFLQAIASSKGPLTVSINAHGGTTYGREWCSRKVEQDEEDVYLLDTRRLAEAFLTRYYETFITKIFSEASQSRFVQMEEVITDLEKNVVLVANSCNGENNTFINLAEAFNELFESQTMKLVIDKIIAREVDKQAKRGASVHRSFAAKWEAHPIKRLDFFGHQPSWDEFGKKIAGYLAGRYVSLPTVIGLGGPETIAYSSLERNAVQFTGIFARTRSLRFKDLWETIEPYSYPRYGATNVSGVGERVHKGDRIHPVLRPIGQNESEGPRDEQAV